MDAFVLIAIVAIILMLAELLLPTGGTLAVIGAIGLVVAGIVALTAEADSAASDYVGPALITLGVLSGITMYFVTRKVISAHVDGSVRTGFEELVGAPAEVRTTLDPDGQVWVDGALWRARLAGEGGPVGPGGRVVVEAVDGLTLLVGPEPPPAQTAEQGAS